MKPLALALLLVIIAVPSGRPYVEDAGTSPETTQAGSYGPVTLSGVSEPSAVPLPLAAPVQLDDGGGVSSVAVDGLATWYCDRPATCTHGYGPGDLIAAIDPSLGIRRGTRITVYFEGRSVSVKVADVCACGGRRIVDLSRLAFSRLADPSRGVIPVSIQFGGGPAQTLPPTDTSPTSPLHLPATR